MPKPSNFLSANIEESIARMMFVAENGHRIGWLQGPVGSGKSTLFRTVQEMLRESGSRVFLHAMSVTGLSSGLRQMAANLGFRCGSESEDAAQAIFGYINRSLPNDRRTVLMFDDLDLAGAEGYRLVETWGQISTRGRVPCTILFSTAAPVIPRSLAKRVDLKASLPVWSASEIESYIHQRARILGHPVCGWEEAAISELELQSGGIVAEIERLICLATVAAEIEQSDSISPRHVRAAMLDRGMNFRGGSSRDSCETRRLSLSDEELDLHESVGRSNR